MRRRLLRWPAAPRKLGGVCAGRFLLPAMGACPRTGPSLRLKRDLAPELRQQFSFARHVGRDGRGAVAPVGTLAGPHAPTAQHSEVAAKRGATCAQLQAQALQWDRELEVTL